jgi:hypothetical protein
MPKTNGGKRPTLDVKGQHTEGNNMTHLSSKNLRIHSVNTATTLHAQASVNNYPCSFLVDTGAAVSLLGSSVWQSSNIAFSCHLQKGPTQQLLGVDGSPLSVLGMARIPVKFGDCVFSIQLIVVEGISEDAILGMDFLQQSNGQIDVNKATLVLHIDNHNMSIPLCSNGCSPPITVAHAALKTTTVVPPYSEVEVLAQVDHQDAGLWLVENCLQTFPVVARAVVSPRHHQIVLRLLNPTAEPAKVFQNQKAARLEKLNDTATISAINLAAKSSSLAGASTCMSEKKQQILWEMAQQVQDITSQQKCQLYELLRNYSDIFAIDDKDLGHTNVLRHSINTGEAIPIRQSPRRLPVHRQHEVTQLIADMLEKDIIEESESPWSSPVVLVTKKDGSFRFCIDYHKVNNVTRKDAYPLPRIDDTLEMLAGSNWLTTIDLLSGYWQVELEHSDREKTAFATRDGLFHFKVLPFGLCNGPATFQRLMSIALSGLQWTSCLVYIDDIIIIGHNFLKHSEHLAHVFSRKSVKYLGHVVSEKGIATEPDKVERVANWPIPCTLKDLQQFMGLATYYRRFVKDFADIAHPLYRLLEKNCPFRWTQGCDKAFKELREKLVSAPILVYPNPTKPFILDTDASETGLGGVLSQEQEGGQEGVIAYGSRALTKQEKRYSTTRKELLAIVTFIQKFRPYLLGSTFVLRTDHHSLKWLKSFRNPEGQLARWLEKLQEYNFEVEHLPGRKHGNADSLSRMSQPLPVNATGLTQSMVEGKTNQELRTLQLDDTVIEPVLTAKESGDLPSTDQLKGYSLHTRRLFQMWDQLEIQEGILGRIFYDSTRRQVHRQLVVPKSIQKSIIKSLHEPGHLGLEKTMSRLRTRFYWPGHYNDVKSWCATCSSCNTRKNPVQKNRGPLSYIQSGSPMQLVATDIVGPFPENHYGNKYILVVVDHFTKWGEAHAIPNQEATTVAKVLVNEIFLQFSPLNSCTQTKDVSSSHC